MKREKKTKVKVSCDWLESHVFNHHPSVKQIITDHDCTGIYQFDVNIRENGRKYGVRVGFFDDRLHRGKFFITPTEGNYQIIDEGDDEK